MKRIILSVVVALGIAATGFASNNVSRSNWHVDIDVAKLSKYLQLSHTQVEEVANISAFFSEKMQGAGFAKEERRSQKLREAVYGNFKLMKRTLTEEQYRKYVHLVNVTLNNRGLNIHLEDIASK
ncbi:MAG: hypothetical protein ACRCZY_01195 [Phocaeicola sp.]